MTTKICLLLDEDVYVTLAQALRKRGFDAVHVQELNRKGFSDREQLELAVKQERCLMSFNVRDFVILHNEFVIKNQEHYGIIVSPQLPIGEALRRVLIILNTQTAEQVKNQILFL
jgi:hypothetical protein